MQLEVQFPERNRVGGGMRGVPRRCGGTDDPALQKIRGTLTAYIAPCSNTEFTERSAGTQGMDAGVLHLLSQEDLCDW